MVKYNLLKENKYDFLFALLILTFPLSNALPNLIFGVLILLFLIFFKKDLLSNYHKSPFFILNILVFYLFFQAIINNSFIQDIGFYKKYFYLLIIPVLFLKVKKVQLLKLAAILAINITIFISIFKTIKFYYYFKYLPFADGWATNSVLHLERPYAGLFSVICIILSFEQIILKTKQKYLFILSFLLSMFFIFIISIRISIITLFILLFIYGVFYLRINWKKKISFSIGLVLLFLTIFFLNRNIAKRFFIDGNIKEVVQTTKEFEPRIIIWDCANTITKQDNFSILFGTDSYSNIKQSLIKCYSENITDFSRRNWFLEHKFNSHSQFIDLYLIGGLIAIILLLLFLIKVIIYNYNDFFTIAIIISFIMVLLIENIFHRQFGCFIFTIFTSLFLKKNHNLLKNDAH